MNSILILFLFIQLSKSICIYNGPGASNVNDYVTGIQEILSNKYTIKLINSTDIITNNILSTCTLLVMPGGADKPYCEALNGEGNKRIKQFIQSGGSYLGICAGAYYASTIVLFDENGPDTISEPRELELYHGMARGPLFKQFNPTSIESVAAVNITLIDQTLVKQYNNRNVSLMAYYHGGPFFCYEDPSYYPSETIAVFPMTDELKSTLYLQPEADAYSSDYPNSFDAIVFMRKGSGKIVLSSVHLENNYFDELNTDNVISRKELLSYLLKKLGLQL